MNGCLGSLLDVRAEDFLRDRALIKFNTRKITTSFVSYVGGGQLHTILYYNSTLCNKMLTLTLARLYIKARRVERAPINSFKGVVWINVDNGLDENTFKGVGRYTDTFNSTSAFEPLDMGSWISSCRLAIVDDEYQRFKCRNPSPYAKVTSGQSEDWFNICLFLILLSNRIGPPSCGDCWIYNGVLILNTRSNLIRTCFSFWFLFLTTSIVVYCSHVGVCRRWLLDYGMLKGMHVILHDRFQLHKQLRLLDFNF